MTRDPTALPLALDVLLVDEELPWPANTGKRLRTWNLVRRLQARHSIVFLCHGEDGQKRPEGWDNVEIVHVPSPLTPLSGPSLYFSLFRNLRSSQPFVVDRHDSIAMRTAFDRLLADRTFDIVHCEWTPYAANIAHVMGAIPCVLAAHNVEHQIWRRYSEAARNPLKKVFLRTQWRRMAAFESTMCPAFDVATCVSPEDAAQLEAMGCANAVVVPNGVDLDYFHPDHSFLPEQGASSIVFTGSMDWRPNQDAVQFFVDQIFPRVRKTLPHAVFRVVGRKPPEALARQWSACPGVEVTGTVDDVRPYLAEAAVVVVPLRIGGGSRLKILEALAMRKAVLSTTLGAEGLDLTHGHTLWIKDEPGPFAAACIDILRHPDHYTAMAAAGRDAVMNRYDWDGIAAIQDEAWRHAAAKGVRVAAA